MSRLSKWLTTIGFVILLLGIGTSDALLTKSTLVLQATETNDELQQLDPDIQAVLRAQGLILTETGEQSLLGSVSQQRDSVQSGIILRRNDRFAFMAWTESKDARPLFVALKEALHQSFSREVTDLRDEVQVRDSHPPRAILTFLDPAIHEERITFVRIRGRLYEFHIPAGKEQEVQGLIDALTE